MDFDTFIDRKGTSCIKFDFAKERGHSEDELSYWVADMDFKTAQEILDALKKRIDHGIFGYTDPDDKYFSAVQNWYKNKFSYTFQKDWLTVTPGVVFAIAAAILAYTKEGESVLIQKPVYYPFGGTIKASKRKVVSSDLVWNGETYDIDFEDFEKKIIEENVKLFLLCNPHNPGGKSWTKEELTKIGKICLKHNVIVFSDEIHSDFVWKPYKHTVFSSISKEFEQNSIIATAPTKTFNLAGLQVSNIFVPNPDLNRKFKITMDVMGYSQPNLLGLEACKAAYNEGDNWLAEVKAYIESNLERATDFIKTNLPKAVVTKPQATYLLWIDFRNLGLSDSELCRKVKDEAKVWIDEGHIFGKIGEGFIRINVATSWEYLEKGLRKICEVLK